MIEFPDKATRQQALDTGIAGRSIGDRFLLITPEVLKSQYQKQKAAGDVKQIDYARPLKQLLSVDESGLITLVQAPTDLFLSAHLDHWSERTKGGKSWQLTQASIAKRIKAGARIPELTTLLNKRLLPHHSIPLLLQTALHKWASKRTSAVELESVIILRCDDPAVVQAIVSSERFKPYLRGRLEDDLIAFDSSKIKEVRKILLWAGLELEEVQYW